MASQASLELPIPLAGVTIIVPGAPVPKGRPRLSTINGHARAFTPTKTRRYEDLIRLEAGRVMEGRVQLQGALTVKIMAFMPMPQRSPSIRPRDRRRARVIRPLTRPTSTIWRR
jgi:Holliday junction resolvase RusA-like endonuclease